MPASRFKQLNEEYHSKFVANQRFDYVEYRNPCRTAIAATAYNFFYNTKISKEFKCACTCSAEPTYARFLTEINIHF